jgi:outer membrane immunogenic protein
MKKLLFASSTLLCAGSAFAADLPPRMSVKAPVVAPVAYSWTGCYLGGHVGAGWSRTDFSEPGVPGFVPVVAPPGNSVRIDGDAGVLGGVQAGCDYQFAGNWVVGVAGDFSWADIKDQGVDPFFAGKNGGPMTLNGRTDRLATLTGRVGYTWDRVLFYGKGGGAWAHDKYSIQNAVALYGGACAVGAPLVFVACNPTGSTDRFGWTAGVGVEWAFANNWTLLVEYDHYGFGNKGVALTDPNNTNNPLFVLNVKQDIDVVKVGINYRFWSAAPVVARY